MEKNRDELIFLPDTFENSNMGYNTALLNKKFIFEEIKALNLNANKKGLKILLQGYVAEDNGNEFIGSGIVDGDNWGGKDYILEKAPLLFGTFFTEWELDGDYSIEEIEDDEFDVYDEFLFRLEDCDYEITSISIEGEGISYFAGDHDNKKWMSEEKFNAIKLEDEEEME